MNISIEYVDPKELKFYDKNTRIHPRSQIDHLKKLIKEFGFNRPLLIDEENVLVSGHGRTIAALELELPRVPCVRLVGYSEEQLKILRIADNQVALDSEWDDAILRQELNSLSNIIVCNDLLGFSQEELDHLTRDIDVNDFFKQEYRSGDSLNKKQKVKQVCCPFCKKEFEVDL